MKKVSKIWQRVMALALVLMMVLSYMPTGVVAEGEIVPQEKKTAVLLAASLTETANYDAVMWPEEDGNPVTPEIVNYTYELKVWNDEKDLQDEVTTTTVINGNSISGGEVYIVPVGTSFEIQISYQGLELKLSNSEIANGSVKKSIEYTYKDIYEVTQHTEVDLDALKPSDVTGAQWSFVEGADYSTYVTNSVYSANTDNTVIGEYVLTIDKTELAKVPVKVSISAPTYTVALTGADGNAWYNTEENPVVVTVTAKANAVLAKCDESVLPAIKADGAQIGEWNTEKNPEFTNTITVSETTEIEVGDQKLTVRVDNEKPTITAVDSYVNNKGTVVRLAYGTVVSGVVAVKVVADGQTYTFDNLDNPSQVLLEGVEAKTVSAVWITNKAGVESDAYPPTGDPAVDVTAAIEINMQIPKIGVVGETTYIKNGTVMDVTISNVSDEEDSPIYLNVENITVAFDDKDGAEGEKTVNWTYSNGAYTGSFVVNDGDKNIKVIAKGANDRTTEKADGRIYACDTEAPSISIDAYADNVKLDSVDSYENKTLTYVVTIADNAYLDLSAIGSEASVSVSYVINGGEAKPATVSKSAANTYEAMITVSDGEKLESISVAAKDNTGNASSKNVQPNVTVDMQRPVITVVPSANVTAFYTNNAVAYAQVTGSDIAFTATVTDANLPAMPAEMAADGWHVNDNKWIKEFSIEVAENQTGAELKIDIPAIKDEAGWVISNDANIETNPYIIIAANGEAKDHLVNTITMKYNEGTGFKLDLLFDRRGASSDIAAAIPALSLQMPKDECNLESKTIYNGNSDLTFKVLVTDLHNNLSGSGIHTVTWDVKDGLNGVFLKKDGADFENVANGTELRLPVAIIKDAVNETPNATITITVTDYLGNVTAFTSEAFSVDNKAPRVSVAYVDEGNTASAPYYNADRQATVTIEDLNLSAELDNNSFTINGIEQLTKADLVEGMIKKSVTISEENEYEILASATDLGNNSAEDAKNEGVDTFILDKTPARIAVEQTTEGRLVNADKNGFDYYDGKVTYVVTVEDKYLNLDADGTQAYANLEYTLEDGTKVSVALDGTDAWTKDENSDKYSYQFDVTDGQVLTGITLEVNDNANNGATMVGNIADQFKSEDGKIWSYVGNQVVVDTTAPVVTVEKSVEEGKNFVRDYKDYDYYDGMVTYTVSVEDAFLTKDVATATIAISYLEEEEPEIINLLENITASSPEAKEETLAYDIVVDEKKVLTGITLQVIDNAGHCADGVLVTDEDSRTEFIKDTNDDAVFDYKGNGVVVDMTAPVVTVGLSSNVKGIYTNDDVIYLELEEPATGDNGIFASQKEQTAGITVTVNDKNIALLKTDIKNGIKGSVETVSGKGEWSGAPTINTDSKLEYKEDITVKADKTGAFTFKLRVFDLAGNPVDAEKIVVKAGEENNYTSADVKVENGEFGSTISVDRRRPSSVDDDTKAPVISIVPSLTATTASNGKELYNNAFSFALVVTDGVKNEYNSGIRTVDWVIDDAIGFVKDATVPNAQQKGTYTQNFTIPVEVNGVGESNDVSLTISAIDNVGNTTTYTREFAVDNQAPRVAVNYDNNDVRNEKYFKANRTATITVTDINFNAATTAITTQVTPTAWEQNGSEWTCSCSYTVDGNYTFAMESTDLANNHTADAAVDYADEAAPKDFVVDKTAPVITVTYNPSSPVGKDNEGVDYYADELNATVSIREVNFNARDVDAKFNSNNSLSGFSSSGNTHTARETFGEGNRYQFSVDYTDLAGNAAVGYNSPVFSVDLTAPTIEITEGTMTNDKLNIVQEDMVLGFTINDAQSNLKNNYSVKVTHLNNEFKTEEVEGADYYSVTTVEERTTVRVNFANIAAEKGKDGIYTVQITAQDYAGNTVSLTPELLFSLNRFGSTFYTDDPFTQDFLVPSADGAVYQQLVDQKLIFKEINPNQVWQDGNRSEIGSVLTIVVNGTTRILTEDVDYTVSVTKEGVGDTKWYVYTYEVDPAIFADGEGTMDGRYSLLFYSEDEAGNKNTNESNEFGMIQLGLDGEYTGKVEFTLDDTTPIISTVGIESEGSYDAENQKLSIFLSDNTPVSIFVKLNGQSVDLAEAAGANNAAWLIWDDVQACYVLNVPEQNTLFGRQNVEIKVTDAAGNITEAEIADFTVSSNLFVRFVNSIWFWVVCAALILLVLLIIVLVKRKQKKEIAA